MLSSIALLFAVRQIPQEAPEVLGPNDPLTVPVSGLERTNSKASIVSVNSNHGFGKALRVVIGKTSPETNWTQLTLPVLGSVKAGDVMLASIWIRGKRSNGKPARAELLFEKATDPWTKSVTHGFALTDEWRSVSVPFRAAESYGSKEAMLSIRLAFGPQTVEMANTSLANFGPKVSLDALVTVAAESSPVGNLSIGFDRAHPRQTMIGLGGDFCQPRYGHTEPMDVVGQYALDHLKVAHARVGLPLEKWCPAPGEYHDDAQAAASLAQLKEMTRRKIPTVLSIWEGPQWMLGGRPEQSGRTLDPSKYNACIAAIAEYLVVARDKYGAKVDYLSFNEPDYGVNFKFTSTTMRDFIRQAGPKFVARGLKTKFLVGDTAGGSSAVAYDTPILSDPTLRPYLGPISFHCWDVLSADDAAYTAIAELGKKFNKPVWCLEAGHDSALWQGKDPWGTWDNALRTAMAYERTLRLAQPSVMDYWTYQDNYPTVDKNGPKPYPVFRVIRQMESVFSPGSRVMTATGTGEDVQALGTIGPGKRFGVLLVNSQGKGTAGLKGLPALTRIKIVSSDAKGQEREKTGRTDAQGRLAVPLPTRSVVTVVSLP